MARSKTLAPGALATLLGLGACGPSLGVATPTTATTGNTGTLQLPNPLPNLLPAPLSNLLPNPLSVGPLQLSVPLSVPSPLPSPVGPS
jgi:hypothetical protein